MKHTDGIKILVVNMYGECRSHKEPYEVLWETETHVLCKFPFPVILFTRSYYFNIIEEFEDYLAKIMIGYHKDPNAKIECCFDKYNFELMIERKGNKYLVVVFFDGTRDENSKTNIVHNRKIEMIDILSQYNKYGKIISGGRNKKHKEIIDLYINKKNEFISVLT